VTVRCSEVAGPALVVMAALTMAISLVATVLEAGCSSAGRAEMCRFRSRLPLSSAWLCVALPPRLHFGVRLVQLLLQRRDAVLRVGVQEQLVGRGHSGAELGQLGRVGLQILRGPVALLAQR
jgi:hypothetical protein